MHSGKIKSADFSKAEFQEQIDEMIRKSREALESKTQSEISEEVRLWAALTPGWTVPLAEMCGFPETEDTGEAGTLFKRMRQAGMFDVYEPAQPLGETMVNDYFVMTPASRAETLQAYLFESRREVVQAKISLKSLRRRSPFFEWFQQAGEKQSRQASAAHRLLDLTAEIGRRVKKFAGEIDMPEELEHWVLLAPRANDPDGITGIFNMQVMPAFNSSDVGLIRDWIEIARPLAALLEYAGHPQLSIAIEQAGRRIELIKRRKNDFRHLASFYRRDEQVTAVRRLVEGPEDTWALHFIGAGGVGKTMIIRYITCLLTSPEDAPCARDYNPFLEEVAVARIDFDYLNPDYPRFNPGLLLWSFAQELRPAANTRSSELFDEADRLFEQVNKNLKADRYRMGKRPTAHPRFIEGVRRYIDALRVLGKRVLLILDTCEELAKADPQSGANNYVDETFRILSALHDGADVLREETSTGNGVQGLRVIFSGRRLLASAGPGWRAHNTKLKPCPFLQLHEIRGFPHPEAAWYLAHEEVPETLIDAVIQSSTPDIESSIRIEFDDPANRPSKWPRCNPYQLRLYMDWALEVPPPDPHRLLSAAAGKYVELRIIERLHDEDLKKILPLTALLGHFDRPLLRAASELDEEDFQRVFEALQSQEWMGVHQAGGVEQPREILSVVRNVRDRMVKHFTSQELPSESTCRRAAKYLQEFTLKQNLRELDWSDFDAALRVMEHDLSEGAAWWAKVESRLFSERDLGWTLDLLARLLGQDGSLCQRDPAAGADVPTENRLRPFVLATQAHAWLHTGEFGRMENNWRKIAYMNPKQRKLPVFQHLYRKSVAGQIAACRFTRSNIDPNLVHTFWRLWEEETFGDPQIAAAAVAACEALVETAETISESDSFVVKRLLVFSVSAEDGTERSVSGPVRLVELVLESSRHWGESQSGESLQQLLAFGFCLAGRSLLLEGKPQESMTFFRKSLDYAPSLAAFTTSSVTPQRSFMWSDWLPPDNLGARVRLEIGRVAYPALLSAKETLAALGECPPDPTSVDVDRLQSILLQLRLALGRPLKKALGYLEWFELRTGEPVFREEPLLPGPMECNAHRNVSPLMVKVCEVFAAFGMVSHALRQLRQVTNNPDRFDLETLQHAERMLLRLICRMRLNDERESTESSLDSSAVADDLVLIWFLHALDGLKRHDILKLPRDFGSDPLKIHGAWQTCLAVTKETLADTLKFGNSQLPKAQVTDVALEHADFAQASLHLDIVELRMLLVKANSTVTVPEIKAHTLNPVGWYKAHPTQPGEALRLMLRSQALFVAQIDVDSDLVNRIGARRAAEIGLEVAEMMALRLPSHSLGILTWARENFEASNDSQGAFIVATLSSMLQAGLLPASHSRNESVFDQEITRLESLLEQANRYYNVLQVKVTDYIAQGPEPKLPKWTHLEQLASAPAEKELDALQPIGWRPWLVRLVACLFRRLHTRVEGAESKDEVVLRNWLEIHYGRPVYKQILLPTEWTGFFSAPKQATIAKPKDNEWIFGLVGCAGSIGILTFGFYGFRWILNYISGGGFGQAFFGWQILSYVLGLIGLGITGVRPWLSLGHLEVDISIARNESESNADAGRSWASGETRYVFVRPQSFLPRLAFRWPPYRLVASRLPEETFPVVGAEPYLDFAKALPQKLRKELKKFFKKVRLNSSPFRIVLQLSDDTHGPCWEALFSTQELFGAWNVLGASRQFRYERRVKASRLSTSLSPWPYRGISLAVGEVPAAVVRRAWEKGVANGREKGVSNGRIKWQLSRRVDNALLGVQLLHIIGSVMEDNSGIRLELTPEQAYATQIEVGKSKFDDEADVFDDSVLSLRASDLRRRYPDLKILILQGYPTRETRFRLESDRHSAILTRYFAAEIAREGVAVVVIPPLEPALASRAWYLMLKKLPSFLRHGPRSLHSAMVEIKKMILAVSSQIGAAWEIAFDFCIYSPEPEESILSEDG